MQESWSKLVRYPSIVSASRYQVVAVSLLEAARQIVMLLFREKVHVTGLIVIQSVACKTNWPRSSHLGTNPITRIQDHRVSRQTGQLFRAINLTKYLWKSFTFFDFIKSLSLLPFSFLWKKKVLPLSCSYVIVQRYVDTRLLARECNSVRKLQIKTIAERRGKWNFSYFHFRDKRISLTEIEQSVRIFICRNADTYRVDGRGTVLRKTLLRHLPSCN